MTQWFSHRLMEPARRHPLAFLSGLAGLGIEIASLWLLSASWGHAGIETQQSLLGQAFGMLVFVFVLPWMWVAPFRVSRNEAARENMASSGVRRAASIVWGILLVAALAQVVAAFSGNRGVALGLGVLVAWLNLVAIVGVIVVRLSVAGRPS